MRCFQGAVFTSFVISWPTLADVSCHISLFSAYDPIHSACICYPQDPRVEKLPCTHPGTYADDCICERVRQHKCYIVATCDRDLRRRIRKVGTALLLDPLWICTDETIKDNWAARISGEYQEASSSCETTSSSHLQQPDKQ